MSGTDEKAVLPPESESGAQPGQSKENPSETPNPSETHVEKEKKGFDALPDHAKEIIARQSEKARRAEERAAKAEAELNAKNNPPKKEPDMSADEREQVALFETLAKKAGYKSSAEIEQYVQERLSQEQMKKDQAAQEEADRKELKDVIAEFDGTNMPKITEEEILKFIESAASDPRKQYLINAPFREIAAYMKAEEIRRIEVDKVLKNGGEVPPTLAKSGGGPKKPERTIQKANSFSALKKIVGGIG